MAPVSPAPVNSDHAALVLPRTGTAPGGNARDTAGSLAPSTDRPRPSEPADHRRIDMRSINRAGGARPRRRPPPGRDQRGPRSSLRRAHRSQRGRQPPADDDVRGLPRRRGALRHRVRVRRWRRRVRSLTPLPGVPTASRRAATGRSSACAARRTRSPRAASVGAARLAAASRRGAHEVKIDALDITVLRGGAARGRPVGDRPRLPPPARRARGARLLRAAAARSSWPRRSTPTPLRQRGQNVGDGTPVHITIPTDNPWVPLRILALGKTGNEHVDADVYLMTDHAPALLPQPDRLNGMTLDAVEPAIDVAARRPAVRRGHGVGARLGVADEDRDRCRRTAARLRPGDRCVRCRRPVPCRGRARYARSRPIRP